jgi:hypothetical protein
MTLTPFENQKLIVKPTTPELGAEMQTVCNDRQPVIFYDNNACTWSVHPWVAGYTEYHACASRFVIFSFIALTITDASKSFPPRRFLVARQDSRFNGTEKGFGFHKGRAAPTALRAVVR